jgi:hypothetical protein
MLKSLLWVAIAIGVVLAGILLYAATLPDDFRVSRSARINATPEKIFPLIANLREFDTWNPFARQDPGIKITYAGPDSGPGAKSTFEDNRVGKGQLEIAGAVSPSQVDMILQMEKPIAARNKIAFVLKPDGAATDVSWTMSGDRPYIGKVIAAVVSMDRMVGTPFEQGLAALKARVEK